MAAFTTNTAVPHRSGPTFFERLDALFTTIARARTRAAEIETISTLSDAELARRGVNRAQAVRHAARAYL